jgi:hypothetical protein
MVSVFGEGHGGVLRFAFMVSFFCEADGGDSGWRHCVSNRQSVDLRDSKPRNPKFCVQVMGQSPDVEVLNRRLSFLVHQLKPTVTNTYLTP